MSPLTFPPEERARLAELLRQGSSLAAALLAAQSPDDVRHLAVSAGALLGGGPCAVLAYDPLVPHLRIDESEGIPRHLTQTFRYGIGESFVQELFELAGRSEDPHPLREALMGGLRFTRPVIYPLGPPSRLRGIWVADALAAGAGGASADLLTGTLRQFGAVVSGATVAAEARATTDRIGVLDPVTGLYDHKSAETYLRRELARARRYRESVSLVLIDLDGFGALNDRRGYQSGDQVLKEIGKLLVGFPSLSRELTGIALCFRESDVAARFGADSFLVLLPTTARNGACLAADRFLAGLRQHRVQLGSESVGVQATAAVVAFPDDGDSAEQLTRLADRLVFEAARAGGDRLVVAPPRRESLRPEP